MQEARCGTRLIPTGRLLTSTPLSVHPQGMLQLRVLVLKGLSQMERLEGLQECPALRYMELGRCKRLGRVDLRGLDALEHLQLDACGELREVDGLEGLSLKRLVVSECPHLDASLQGALGTD
jgi:hypothetical protein